jgi:hypothetical protein
MVSGRAVLKIIGGVAMAKILKDTEMADIIHRAVNEDGMDCADAYSRFLEDLGELICTHFGGERGCVSEPDYPGDKLGWTCGFRINDCVPSDGGVFQNYDPDVTWINAGEEQA